jgi:hypothetical protein
VLQRGWFAATLKNLRYALHEPMAGANCCGAPSLFWKNLNPVLEMQFEVE